MRPLQNILQVPPIGNVSGPYLRVAMAIGVQVDHQLAELFGHWADASGDILVAEAVGGAGPVVE